VDRSSFGKKESTMSEKSVSVGVPFRTAEQSIQRKVMYGSPNTENGPGMGQKGKPYIMSTSALNSKTA
jgi:hypothetical protein